MSHAPCFSAAPAAAAAPATSTDTEDNTALLLGDDGSWATPTQGQQETALTADGALPPPLPRTPPTEETSQVSFLVEVPSEGGRGPRTKWVLCSVKLEKGPSGDWWADEMVDDNAHADDKRLTAKQLKKAVWGVLSDKPGFEWMIGTRSNYKVMVMHAEHNSVTESAFKAAPSHPTAA